jgi:hypothetical protein
MPPASASDIRKDCGQRPAHRLAEGSLQVTAGTATSIDISNNADMSGAKNSVVATAASSNRRRRGWFLAGQRWNATVRLTT